MRFKTLVLIPLIAVLTVGLHNKNVEQVSLPISQSHTSANAPHEIKLEQIIINDYINNRIDNKKASRSRQSVKPKLKVSLAKGFAKSYMQSKYGWGEKQYSCLESLWNRESGWRYNADNPNSSAYGIPQALPGKKMASAGSDWKTNPKTQIKWGLNYIDKRYKTPCGAWSASKKKGWY